MHVKNTDSKSKPAIGVDFLETTHKFKHDNLIGEQ